MLSDPCLQGRRLIVCPLLILSVVLLVPIAGQESRGYPARSLKADQARGDVALLRRALEVIHPGLHRYATRERVEAAFAKLDAGIATGVTDAALYRDLAVAVGVIRCGHTRVMPPPALEQYRARVASHLPFRFRLIGGRMLVAEAAPGIVGLSRGTEVRTINGKAVTDLITRIAPTVPVDGDTDHIRPSRLENAYEYRDSGFDQFLPLFMGFRTSFRLGIGEGAQSRTIEVPAITSKQWRQMQGGYVDFADAVSWKALDEKTALLRVGSFVNYRAPVDPEKRLRSAFLAIKEAGAEHLILDLRDCGGGSDDVARALLGFLVTEPLTSLRPLVKSIRFGDLVEHLSTWEPRAFEMPEDQFVHRKDGWYELKPMPWEPTALTPLADGFRGRLTVLISPLNASGATMVIATLEEKAGARLVGEATGGSATGPCGGVLFTLTLPASGIKVNIPVMRSRTGLDFPEGRGVFPDLSVPLSAEHFRRGTDPALEAARR